MQKKTRTDPKPGEVTPKDLMRREVWFYFDVEQQGAAKRGAQRHIQPHVPAKGRVTKVQGKCLLEITYMGGVQLTGQSRSINTLLGLNNYWVAGTEAV